MRFIIFYHKDTLETGKNFEKNILQNWHGTEIEIFQTIQGIRSHIGGQHNFFENEIYIILVDSKRRLLELSFLSDLVEDKNLILILPNLSQDMMKMSMCLSPKFITGISDDYKDLHLVLKQMSGRKEHRKQNSILTDI